MEITNDTTNNEISTDQVAIATFTCNIIPDKVSYLKNDVGYITKADVPIKVSELENDIGYITINDIPTKLSAFENDTGYITRADIPTEISAFNNDIGYITEAGVPKNLSEYNNDVPFAKISELPTKVSELENDSKYMNPVKVKAGNNISTEYTEDTVTINAGDPLPDQTGKENKFLMTDGTKASWETVITLPEQSGNAGRYLTTDGTEANWTVMPEIIQKIAQVTEQGTKVNEFIVSVKPDTPIYYYAETETSSQLESVLFTIDFSRIADAIVSNTATFELLIHLKLPKAVVISPEVIWINEARFDKLAGYYLIVLRKLPQSTKLLANLEAYWTDTEELA